MGQRESGGVTTRVETERNDKRVCFILVWDFGLNEAKKQLQKFGFDVSDKTAGIESKCTLRWNK